MGIAGAWVQGEAAGAATPDTFARVLSGHDGAFRIAVSALTREKGVVTAEAEGYADLVRRELGEDWLTPGLFRIGASGLLDDLVGS